MSACQQMEVANSFPHATMISHGRSNIHTSMLQNNKTSSFNGGLIMANGEAVPRPSQQIDIKDAKSLSLLNKARIWSEEEDQELAR